MESSNVKEAYLDVVVEVFEVNSSVAFELFLDEDLTEFCWANIMLESPHATNFFKYPPFHG